MKTFHYRLYPTKEQAILLAKTFGCVRVVYNKALELKSKLYQTEKKGISLFAISNIMTEWKDQEEYCWLREVNSQALQMSLRHLDHAFTNFFKNRSEYPTFKNKYSKQSFCNCQSTKIDWENERIFIPKFKGGIKAVLHREFKGKIKSSTVSKTSTDKYFISIVVEQDDEHPVCKKAEESKTLGIDLGIKDFLTNSEGNKIENPKHLSKKLKTLRRAQRKLSRKAKGSKNREKQRVRVARIYEKVANTRKDFLHKVTDKIAKNQSYSSVAIEDLAVKDMIAKGKKNKLSRQINDAGWGMFREFLTYKCEREGKNLLVIGRFEPSSRLCECGYYNHGLTLKDRIWTCPDCHTSHDRDTLAARNIKRFAFREQNFLPLERRESTLGEIEVTRSLEPRSHLF